MTVMTFPEIPGHLTYGCHEHGDGALVHIWAPDPLARHPHRHRTLCSLAQNNPPIKEWNDDAIVCTSCQSSERLQEPQKQADVVDDSAGASFVPTEPAKPAYKLPEPVLVVIPETKKKKPAVVEGMRATVSREELLRCVAASGRSVSTKTTIQVLEHLLLSATKGAEWGLLTVGATNLNQSTVTRTTATVEIEGAITVPLKLLSDVLVAFEGKDVVLSLDSATNILNLACTPPSADGKTRKPATAQIHGIEASQFPVLPEPETELTTIPASVLRQGFARVYRAADEKATFATLTGVNLVFDPEWIVFQATDSFRIYRDRVPNTTGVLGNLVIPVGAVADLISILQDEGDVCISYGPNKSMVIVQQNSTTWAARLIDNKYPDLERAFNTKARVTAKVSTADIKRAVKLAANYATVSNNTMQMRFRAGEIGFAANAAGSGGASSYIDGETNLEGDEEEIFAANVKYVQEVLGIVKTETIYIEADDAKLPIVFREVEGAEHMILTIMPMRPR
jgi:DNA polymerase III subunit beta